MSIEAEWIECDHTLEFDSNTLIDLMYGDGSVDTVYFKSFGTHSGPIHNATHYRIHNAFEGAPDEATHLLGHCNGSSVFVRWDGSALEFFDIGGMSGYNISDTEWQVIATRKRDEHCDCADPSQCWEPCGELGNSDEHAVRADGDYTALSDALHGRSEEYTGGSVSYYTARIDHPTNPSREPYEAECNDIIEALNMNYAEGNAFKAIWRKCAARLGTAKKGYTDGLYDAEKVVFFGERMVEQEKHK